MKNFYLIIFAFAGLLVSQKASAQCSITQVSQNGNTYVFTAPASQAYYWTVTGAAISGSNTQQSVTVLASSTNFTLCLTTFNNGQCDSCCVTITPPPCGYYIEESDMMCYSASAPNFKKRGRYVLYNCEDMVGKLADWRFIEGNSNFQFVYGPNNTSYVHVMPINPYFYGNVTLQAFEPGTNILLASLVTEVYDCDVCMECRTTSGTVSFNDESKQVIFTSDKKQKIQIEVVDMNSGTPVYVLKNQNVNVGKNTFDLRNSGITESKKVYVVRLTTADNEVASLKILY